jgi:hypothetical protein
MKMSELKFVPGPWRVRINNGNILVVGPNNIHIGTSECKDRFPTNKATQAANARLMAAAPDMYEALRACIKEMYNESIKFCIEEFYKDATVLDDYLSAVKAGEAALAKAEGRS